MLEPVLRLLRGVHRFAGARAAAGDASPARLRARAEALRAAIGPRARVLLLNSPHNPTGRVLTRAELELIAAVCVEHDLICISDEVYEHLVFDGEHIPRRRCRGWPSAR